MQAPGGQGVALPLGAHGFARPRHITLPLGLISRGSGEDVTNTPASRGR